jgi:hypothetical protein
MFEMDGFAINVVRGTNGGKDGIAIKHYIALDGAAAQRLDMCIIDNKPLSKPEFGKLVDSIVETLSLFERRGLFHTHIEPGNLGKTPDGKFKLVTYGTSTAAFPDLRLIVPPTFTTLYAHVQFEKRYDEEVTNRGKKFAEHIIKLLELMILNDRFSAGLALLHIAIPETPPPDLRLIKDLFNKEAALSTSNKSYQQAAKKLDELFAQLEKRQGEPAKRIVKDLMEGKMPEKPPTPAPPAQPPSPKKEAPPM